LPCEEVERLTSVYFDAICHNAEAGRTVADMKSEAWSLASEQFSAATKALTRDHIANMSKADFMALRARAEDARLASDNARILLELHPEEHGC
jgi:hypothetical protein